MDVSYDPSNLCQTSIISNRVVPAGTSTRDQAVCDRKLCLPRVLRV